MAKKSKQYQDAAKLVDRDKAYDVTEAVDLVKKMDFAKFDATVEVAFKLNVDTKQADQQLRGAVVLPNGTGKDQTVSFLLRVTRLKKLKKPVLTLLVKLIQFRRSKTVGQTLMSQSLPLT